MSRPLAVTLCVLFALALLAAMRWGWVRRAGRTGAGLPALPTPWEPPAASTDATVVDGVYISTTTSGDWLDRVAAAGLGVRSAVTAHVDPRGVLLLRQGAPDVAIPAGSIVGARRERGIAGKVSEPGSVVVIRWRLGDRELDTGIRPRYSSDRERLTGAINALTESLPAPATPEGTTA